MSRSACERKAQPNCLRYFLGHFQNQQAASVEQLIALLQDEAGYDKCAATAKETVTNAIRDGLLLNVTTAAGQKWLRLPTVDEIPALERDCYCFECHLAGALEHCRLCTRSFHRLCYRKCPERPNYSVPSAKKQKNRMPLFSSDTETDSEMDEEEADGNASTAQETSSFVADGESEVRAISSLLPVDQTSNITDRDANGGGGGGGGGSLASPQVEEVENVVAVDAHVDNDSIDNIEGKYELHLESNESKLDVVCIGEIRPPTRKRTATRISNRSYKSEITPHDDEARENETDLDLCTCCRLLQIKTLRNPPHLQRDELCYLLNFIFSRNRTWISVDVPFYLDVHKVSPEFIEIATKLLFNMPAQALDKVDEKIASQQYAFLMDFLVDILDVQHSIGIFFGHDSTELESTKWMIRDITHELSELRRCFDCFRYSYEKDRNLWFAKPCVQRHELVFAKHCSFPYWPAKVIRVLANGKYDVRFFGGNHSRALIEAHHIRPIDTDIKSLKLGHSPAMRKAMKELHYHQILSKYSPSEFSYHADKERTEEIIQNVLGMECEGGKGRRSGGAGGGRARKRVFSSTITIADLQQSPHHHSNHHQPQQHTSGVISMAKTPAATMLSNEPAPPSSSSRSIIQCTFSNEESPAVTPTNRDSNKIRRTTRRDAYNNAATAESSLKAALEELDKAHALIKSEGLKRKQLQKRIETLNKIIKKHEVEKPLLKRKQWCYWCLSEGLYLCCFRAAYCSNICQKRHWKNGHSKECRSKQNANIQTTGSTS